jgi:hypothetical protein
VQVEYKLGLTGVTIELFDEDFEEWCGPASLDEMNAVSTIRLKATGKVERPPEPASSSAPAPAPAAAGSSAYGACSARRAPAACPVA